MKQLILGDARHELANTRRILESLLNEHMTWKPHLKSMTLGSLTTHLVNLLNWQHAKKRWRNLTLMPLSLKNCWTNAGRMSLPQNGPCETATM